MADEAAPDCAAQPTQTVEDALDPGRAQALTGALGLARPAPRAGDALPLAWHWVYFWDAPAHQELGQSGHRRLGAFLPELGLPARMWASGRIFARVPLRLGTPARRISAVTSIDERAGRSGRLVFVTVTHRMEAAGREAVREEQILVYRDPPSPGTPPRPGAPAPGEARWRREWHADARMLFRYSALTYNAHRIHYDIDYCRDRERYPGLVVHGPLLATALAELAAEIGAPDQRTIAEFAFRAEAPVFHIEAFAACAHPAADGLTLWIEGPDGGVRMRASVRWA